MLVHLLATILRGMTLAKVVETTCIQVVTELLFHALHRPISDVGLIGGQRPLPGEVSLAHHGLLWLDAPHSKSLRKM
jgi:magnesium chelatase family protein